MSVRYTVFRVWVLPKKFEIENHCIVGTYMPFGFFNTNIIILTLLINVYRAKIKNVKTGVQSFWVNKIEEFKTILKIKQIKTILESEYNCCGQSYVAKPCLVTFCKPEAANRSNWIKWSVHPFILFTLINPQTWYSVLYALDHS